MPPVIIVIPCYNEARRLDLGQVQRLLSEPEVSVLCVDDGSTDGTAGVLESWRDQLGSSRVDTLTLPHNGGKAEAVRAGLRRALERGAELVGYLDADFATPPDEALRLLSVLRSAPVDAVIAARIALMGAHIQRSPTRHYLGRIFASAASLILNVSVYDTQCGAKFFRASPALREALEQPFCSRWAFDVELLGRYLIAGGTAIEVPLQAWGDVSGSKLRPGSMMRAGVDLAVIARELGRRRRRMRRG